MKPNSRLLFCSLLLVAAGAGFYVWREHSRLAERRETLEQRMSAMRATRDRAQRDRETAEREWVALQRAAKEAEAANVAAQAGATASAWEQKVATLRTLLARHPAWAIPEIGLLSPDEFIFLPAMRSSKARMPSARLCAISVP